MTNIPKFKDSIGRFRTQSLFWEYRLDNYDYYYTLAKEDRILDDGTVVPSLYKLYLAENDPTEWSFANKHLHSWDHWQILLNNQEIAAHVEGWRKELQIKLQSEHFEFMKDQARTAKTSSERQAATRWLNDFLKHPKGAKERGRPSKEEVEGRLKAELRSLEEYREDAERLGIKH